MMKISPILNEQTGVTELNFMIDLPENVLTSPRHCL
jgi:hypothetical protein